MKTSHFPWIATLVALAMAGCASHPPNPPVAVTASPARPEAHLNLHQGVTGNIGAVTAERFVMNNRDQWVSHQHWQGYADAARAHKRFA